MDPEERQTPYSRNRGRANRRVSRNAKVVSASSLLSPEANVILDCPNEQVVPVAEDIGQRSRNEFSRPRMDEAAFMTTRPPGKGKIGTTGEARRYFTNYFILQSKKNLMMRLHEVKFRPELNDNKIRRALLRTKKEDIAPYMFDGTQLFTTRELSEECLSFTVGFHDKEDEVYTVDIRFIKTAGILDSAALQLHNLIVRKAQMEMNLVQLGRHFYDAKERINIPQYRLELWPGYITSMRTMESEVLLNVDLIFKVCRTDNIFDYMKQVRSQNSNNFREICEKAIIGTIVLTAYESNQRTYKVDAINWDLRPTSTFLKKNEEISFVDYYKMKNYEIRYLNQPMLVSHATQKDIRRGNNGDRILVPEMCFQTGLNDEMRSNFRLMKDLSQHLHMAPTERLKKTVCFMNNMKQVDGLSKEIERWGMRFLTEPVDVDGRVLPSEDIIFQGPSSFKPNEQSDWSMAFRSQRMLMCKELKEWVLYFSNRDSRNIQNLVQTMKKVATPLGYRIHDPETVALNDSTLSSFTRAIDRSVCQYNNRVDMMMIILPNNSLDFYAAVKKKCSVDYGIPSQCFQAKNLSKNLMSICTKLVIQMNAKQGGQPWSVNNPLKGVMVVGFDVHNGRGMKSCSAMTATMGNTLASYYSTVNDKVPDIGLDETIGVSFANCLRAYYKANDQLPSRILFYRDGVGEGQLKYVYESELGLIKRVINSEYNKIMAVLPKFTMIVVTKRINTRIFEIRSHNQVINPQPGTVIDDKITCPEKYDFYLVPQMARQGTVSPVAFNILYDDSDLDADKIQRFTFKLCHLYYNWSGTVAVPAPCQYAHKLAFLTGTALHEAVNNKLSNLLHFL